MSDYKLGIGILLVSVLIVAGATYLSVAQDVEECTGKYNTAACHQAALDRLQSKGRDL